jgi:hypothetical protein
MRAARVGGDALSRGSMHARKLEACLHTPGVGHCVGGPPAGKAGVRAGGARRRAPPLAAHTEQARSPSSAAPPPFPSPHRAHGRTARTGQEPAELVRPAWGGVGGTPQCVLLPKTPPPRRRLREGREGREGAPSPAAKRSLGQSRPGADPPPCAPRALVGPRPAHSSRRTWQCVRQSALSLSGGCASTRSPGWGGPGQRRARPPPAFFRGPRRPSTRPQPPAPPLASHLPSSLSPFPPSPPSSPQPAPAPCPTPPPPPNPKKAARK